MKDIATLKLRRAVAEDAPFVSRIYVDSWNKGFGDLMPSRQVSPEIIERWRSDLTAGPPNYWCVAECEGAVVGFVGVGPCRDPVDSDLGELDTIAVDPRFWRRCIGRRLMTVAIMQLSKSEYRRAVLWSLAGYDPARRFYEQAGWSLDGEVRDGGRQVRYARDIVV
jgi:N-acetylglutamate synthase-like GNAT family acetyltransferase